MQNIYGIGFLREQKEPYCIPMNLKEIDKLTTTYSKKELLEMIKKNDSTVTQTDEKNLRIFKIYQKKWKESHLEYISKEKEYLLNFSFEELFMNKKNAIRILNILYNHFSILLKKEHVEEKMKETIQAMKESPSQFLDNFYQLSYENQRQIRTYLDGKIDLDQKITEENREDLEEYQLKKKKAS